MSSSDRIDVRTAVLLDRDWIMQCQCSMARETESLELDRDLVHQGVTAVLQDGDKGAYWIAQFGGQRAGVLLVTQEWSDWRNGCIWWLQSVYVEPAWRRRGVFRALYEHLRDRVQRDPALIGLRLYVERNNLAAQRTYAQLGMSGEHYQVYQWLPGPATNSHRIEQRD